MGDDEREDTGSTGVLEIFRAGQAG